MDRDTHDFYTYRAEEWAAALPGPVSPHFEPFLAQLEPGARILDLGCGDGRDSEGMVARGFVVESVDGVAKMVELANQRQGVVARQMLYEELEAEAEFDAVWAHAALLHVEAEALPAILRKVHRALKPGGLHFATYKGGEGGARDDHGRFYSYIPREDLRAAYTAAGPWEDFTLETSDGRSYGGVPTIWHVLTARRPAE